MRRALKLLQSLLKAVSEVASACGQGRRECVVYLTAARGHPDQVVGYIHPSHQATAVSTEVDQEELGRVWDELRSTGRMIVCQVHTHPGTAFHSGTDDHYPVVHSVGFLSLVLPGYADRGLKGAHLAVYQGGGRWLAPDRWEPYLLLEDE
ncbi:MAG: Mov34/MPN/PAD-1 family protein [Actinomycetota bacterium]